MYASNYTCIAKFILNSCAPVGGDFQYHNGGQQQHQKTKKRMDALSFKQIHLRHALSR